MEASKVQLHVLCSQLQTLQSFSPRNILHCYSKLNCCVNYQRIVMVGSGLLVTNNCRNMLQIFLPVLLLDAANNDLSSGKLTSLMGWPTNSLLRPIYFKLVVLTKKKTRKSPVQIFVLDAVFYYAAKPLDRIEHFLLFSSHSMVATTLTLH